MKDYSCLSQLDVLDSFIFKNRFIIDELNYDKESMTKVHALVMCIKRSWQW